MNEKPLVLVSHNYGGGILAFWREQSEAINLDLVSLMEAPKTKFFRIKALLKKFKILCFTPGYSNRTVISNDWITHLILVIMFLLNRNLNIIMMFHGKDFLGRFFSNYVIRILNKILKKNATAIFVSQYIKEVYNEAGLIAPLNQVVFPIKTTDFKGTQKNWLPGKKFNFLFVGHLNSQKGIEELIQILNRLKGEYQHFDFELTVVGSGPLLQKLQSSNVNFDMHILGQINHLEVHKIMKASDLLLFYPRQAEAFGRVVVEANEHNCSVLACTENCSIEFCEITATICVTSETEFVRTLKSIMEGDKKLPVPFVKYRNPIQEKFSKVDSDV